MKLYMRFIFFIRMKFYKETLKDFDYMFYALYKYERIKYKPLAKEFEVLNINKKIFRQELKRLLLLGFATRTVYLNGEKEVELTSYGKRWFALMYNF